jgi:hypothetical protein
MERELTEGTWLPESNIWETLAKFWMRVKQIAKLFCRRVAETQASLFREDGANAYDNGISPLEQHHNYPVAR